MLRKKVVVAIEWDKMLPFYVFAYNTTVHESTGESPLYLLHGFDAYVPWDSVPDHPISKYTMDYAHEVATGTESALTICREVNERIRQRMKVGYDRDKGAGKVPPKVAKRVYMKVPTEKQ